MNPTEMFNLMRKAQQTQSKMGKITVAGRSKSGNTAVLLNGMGDILELEFEEDFDTGDKSKLSREIIEAFRDARRELTQNVDLDSLRDMLA